MKPFLLGFVLLLVSRGLDRDAELLTLRERAETILSENQSLEITTSEARRRVQLLLKDLLAWAESYGVDLEVKTHRYDSPVKKHDEPLTADHCPLFFEEELEKELCPLDLAHSEVWGGRTLICRYHCE